MLAYRRRGRQGPASRLASGWLSPSIHGLWDPVLVHGIT
jgi:hypothetical protein